MQGINEGHYFLTKILHGGEKEVFELLKWQGMLFLLGATSIPLPDGGKSKLARSSGTLDQEAETVEDKRVCAVFKTLGRRSGRGRCRAGQGSPPKALGSPVPPPRPSPHAQLLSRPCNILCTFWSPERLCLLVDTLQMGWQKLKNFSESKQYHYVN